MNASLWQHSRSRCSPQRGLNRPSGAWAYRRTRYLKIAGVRTLCQVYVTAARDTYLTLAITTSLKDRSQPNTNIAGICVPMNADNRYADRRGVRDYDNQ
jgi:hypothetical protein